MRMSIARHPHLFFWNRAGRFCDAYSPAAMDALFEEVYAEILYGDIGLFREHTPWFKLGFMPPSTPGAKIYLPQGMLILDLPNGNTPVDPAIWSGSLADGVSLRQSWHFLEPQQGVFDFSYLDGQIALAQLHQKSVMLRIVCNGPNMPSWVQANSQLFMGCTDGNWYFVYWDPFAQAAIADMYAALGTRYGSILNVKWVAVSSVNSTSGDWDIPLNTANWNLAHNFIFPAPGQSVTVQVAPGGPPIYPGVLTFVGQTYGWTQVTAVDNPKNPTTATIVNLGYPGNDNSGTSLVPIGKGMYVSDLDNWLSPMYNYTSQRAINAVLNNIEAVCLNFPNSICTLACGRNGNLDPTQDYVCQQISIVAAQLYGPQYEIQKNQANCTTPLPPATNTNFYIFDLLPYIHRGGQFTWFSVGDPTYRNNKGNPIDPFVALQQTFYLQAKWGEYRLETYEVDAKAMQQVGVVKIPISPIFPP